MQGYYRCILKKSSTSSVQYNPMVLVNGERIAPVKTGESFVYLGKQFNFGMDIQNIKDEVKQGVSVTSMPINSVLYYMFAMVHGPCST